MNFIGHTHWIDLPCYNGDRVDKEGRPTCYRSNPQQIDAMAIFLAALMEKAHSSVSVMSMLRTHHEVMLGQLKDAGRLPESGRLTGVDFCYAGGVCHNADTLIVLPVIATGTSYEPLINEIRYRSTDLFDELEQQEFERVIVLGERQAWLSIGGYFARRLAEIPSTTYPVSERFFRHDIWEAVETLFGDKC